MKLYELVRLWDGVTSEVAQGGKLGAGGQWRFLAPPTHGLGKCGKAGGLLDNWRKRRQKGVAGTAATVMRAMHWAHLMLRPALVAACPASSPKSRKVGN